MISQYIKPKMQKHLSGTIYQNYKEDKIKLPYKKLTLMLEGPAMTWVLNKDTPVIIKQCLLEDKKK